MPIRKRWKEEIEANNEKFSVLLGVLISQMDIHQARTEANQREMKTKMDAWLEETKAWQKEMTACK
jgi:hypothetical protein